MQTLGKFDQIASCSSSRSNVINPRFQRGYSKLFSHSHKVAKSKRAQIKMFETIGVLVVFFFLLAIGSSFYFGAQNSALKKEKDRVSEQLAFNTFLKALYLPELDCSFLVTQKDNCIDKIKLGLLSDLLRTNSSAHTDYYGVFGDATVNVTQVYPPSDFAVTLYENRPGNVSQFVGKSQSPILLFDSWNDEYAFGMVEVTVYVQ